MIVKDYGDMLGQVIGKKCLAFVKFGSYSGDWIAAIDNGDMLELWKGYYGSCSGCDFLEAESKYDYIKDDYVYEISEEKAKEHFKEDKSFLDIPKELFKDITVYRFQELLPANIRSEIYEFEPKELLEEICKGLK